MKPMARLFSALALVMLIVPVSTLPGCGNDTVDCGDYEAVPDGSTITITPSSVSWTDLAVNVNQNFTVEVRDDNGDPIPYAAVCISGGMAEPRVPGHYQFYYYPGGDQRPGGNAAMNSGFPGQTNESGVYTFSILVYGPGNEFSDTIYVTSGTAVSTASVDSTTT